MVRKLSWTVAALVMLPLLVVADDSANRPTKQAKATPATRSERARQINKKQIAKKTAPLKREEEEAATAFVTKHHDELLELLIHLKEGLPQEYNKAIRELSRTSDRLAMLAGRDKTRYKLELKLWQAKSRRQLLTARLRMGRDDGLVQQVRETLTEEHLLQLAILKHERARFAARVKRLDEQIAKQEKTRKASIDRQLATITKDPKNSERKVKTTKRKRPDSKDRPANTQDSSANAKKPT